MAAAAPGRMGSAIRRAQPQQAGRRGPRRPASAPAGRGARLFSSGVRSMPRVAISRALPTSTSATVDCWRERPSCRGLEAVAANAGPRRAAGSCRAVEDGRGQRVLAPRSTPAANRSSSPSRSTPSRAATSAQRWPAARERAGLVEHDRVDPVRALERLAAPDQDARLGPAAGADHDRRRRREAHRARTGDDQHRDQVHQREGQARLRPESRQNTKVSAAKASTAGTNWRGPGRPAAGSAPWSPAPCSTSRTICASAVSRPTRGGPEHEGAVRVEGRADDLVAGLLLDRHGFAGEHRLVDRRRALDDDAVDRHLLARPDAQQVARWTSASGTSTSDAVATTRAVLRGLEPISRRDRAGRPGPSRASSQRPAR